MQERIARGAQPAGQKLPNIHSMSFLLENVCPCAGGEKELECCHLLELVNAYAQTCAPLEGRTSRIEEDDWEKKESPSNQKSVSLENARSRDCDVMDSFCCCYQVILGE